jgi:hypothetical protein
MHSRVYNLCLSFIVITLVGCSNADNPTEPDAPDNSAPPLIENSYEPLSIGSYWKYTGGENYIQKVIGGTMIDGKYFFTLEYSQSGSPIDQFEYMREEARTIYSLVPTFAPEIVPSLKYDQPPGFTWTATRTIKSTTNYYTYTIVAKNLTRNVLGKEYRDVLHLRCKNYILTESGDTLSFFSDSDSYYAKGVGNIEYTKDIVGTTYLQEYYIKK